MIMNPEFGPDERDYSGDYTIYTVAPTYPYRGYNPQSIVVSAQGECVFSGDRNGAIRHLTDNTRADGHDYPVRRVAKFSQLIKDGVIVSGEVFGYDVARGGYYK